VAIQYDAFIVFTGFARIQGIVSKVVIKLVRGCGHDGAIWSRVPNLGEVSLGGRLP
jgi:hypothetical protein